MYYSDVDRGRSVAKDPAVVRFENKYIMYYSIPPYGDGRTNNTWAIGVAESQDLSTWSKIGEILPEHDYEENGICAPGAIVLRDQVHIFYQTYGNGPKDSICHASSTDGVLFDRNPTNPVFRPTGEWNCGRAIDADVIHFKDKLLLYFATRDPLMKQQMLGVAAAPIESTFSRKNWVQLCPGPILQPELWWEQDCIEAPAVCNRDGKLFMFYAGAYNNKPQQIGCAMSKDGIRWTRLSEQPILPNGQPGSWNSSESGHPFVFVDEDGQTYLFYQGNNDLGKTWYLSKAVVDWSNDVPSLTPDLG
ncbi:MAG: family 43 glycosylhydrolase [Limnochordia bacterium]|nr:family 43 glycosylhydrolase [Limnochordia bacterium]MDD4517984.1 family 43 glycosylhydrolase [Limnochordia bacterium]